MGERLEPERNRNRWEQLAFHDARNDQKQKADDRRPRGRDAGVLSWGCCSSQSPDTQRILTLVLLPQTASTKKASLEAARAQMAQHLPGPPVPRGPLCVCSRGEARPVRHWLRRVHRQFLWPGKRNGAAGKEGTITLGQFFFLSAKDLAFLAWPVLSCVMEKV